MPNAALGAVIFRNTALRMKFDLRDGMKVIVRGRLTMYAPQGRKSSCRSRRCSPKGIGPLELAFRQLKEKLSARGFFEPRAEEAAAALSAPRCAGDQPDRLGGARPARGAIPPLAALRSLDLPRAASRAREPPRKSPRALGFLNRLGVRPAYRIRDCSTSSSSAAAAAVSRICGPSTRSRSPRPSIDSRIPIVTGVGHEDDLTIADLVADCRALTPSEAAERAVPDQDEMLAALDKMQDRLKALLRRQLETAHTAVSTTWPGGAASASLWTDCTTHERTLDDYADRLNRAVQQRVGRLPEALEGHAARLDSLSPLHVLARGYTLTRKEEEREVLRQAADVQPGRRTDHPPAYGRRCDSRVEDVTP